MTNPRLRGLVPALALGLLLLPATAAAAWLGGIDFSHPSPSFLPHDERVHVDIDYQHADAGGVRLFVIPRSGGGDTPNLATSPSSLEPAGTGTATRWFTVQAGSAVVDAVRILMTNADQSVTYFDFTVRVRYEYGPTGLFNLGFSHGDRSVLANGEDLDITFDWATSEDAGVVIFARPYLNGSLVGGYAASGGEVGGAGGSGSQHFTFPSVDVKVNHVRFTVYDAAMSTPLLQFDQPVTYHWADVGLANFTLAKPGPAMAVLNEDMVVSFDWTNPTGGNMLVWTLPLLANDHPPGGYSSPSSFLPPGAGATSRFFGLGTPGELDAFRVLCTNADQSVVLVDVQVPVSYVFGHHAVDNITTEPERPAILDPDTPLGVTFDYHTDYPGNVLAWALPWHEGAWPPDFGYAGSPTLPSGSGTTARFVTGLEPGTAIDHLRFLMTDAAQTETLLDWKLAFSAHWDGTAATSPVPDAVPAPGVTLGQNYPNPFNPLTTIPVQVDATRRVRLAVYDLRGRRVATLVDGLLGEGRHEIPFDGTRLASGQYVYRLEGGAARTMTLLK